MVALLSGCASSADLPAGPSSPPVSSPTAEQQVGNGSLYLSRSDGTTRSITRYAIDAAGALGPAQELLVEPQSATEWPFVIDGIGGTVLLGELAEYWTTALQLREAATGDLIATLAAPDWCGGEGLTYNPCALADPQTLVRTSTLGGPDDLDATIRITSLPEGADEAVYGPIRNLQYVYGTGVPGTVLLTVADDDPVDPPEASAGALQRMDTASGATSTVAVYSADWRPLCPLGADAMLGYEVAGETMPLRVVGDAPAAAAVALEGSDNPVGCSADGAYVFVDGEQDGRRTVDRVAVADGARTTVLELTAEQSIDMITR